MRRVFYSADNINVKCIRFLESEMMVWSRNDGMHNTCGCGKWLTQSMSSRYPETARDPRSRLPEAAFIARDPRVSIVFTTIPSSINLSTIIAQTLDTLPTRLHFIVPRSIFKRRRLSQRVCFATVCAWYNVHIYTHYALDTYLSYITLPNPSWAHNNAYFHFMSFN